MTGVFQATFIGALLQQGGVSREQNYIAKAERSAVINPYWKILFVGDALKGPNPLSHKANTGFLCPWSLESEYIVAFIIAPLNQYIENIFSMAFKLINSFLPCGHKFIVTEGMKSQAKSTVINSQGGR